MEKEDIVKYLETFVKQQKSEVNYGTYRTTSRSSLLKEGLSTRANSVWKQSQFVVAYYNNEDSNNISDYLKGWAELTRGIYNQFLLLECPKGVWTCYDKHGNPMKMEELKSVPQRFIDESSIQVFYSSPNKYSRQIIFYGAPGTGKSYEVKKYAKSDNSIRTTFHPDSDYSTFVGAYKPTMGTKPLYGLFGDKTVRFKADGNELNEETISYKFVPQAFLKAYCTAWRKWSENDTEPFFLVIEEINRGNCAQIFGDLFQLLDRDCQKGFSTYAIEADDDIRRFICEDEALSLSDITVEDIRDKDDEMVATGEEIAKGKKLVLPPNLYIWATMNTSDQSLFPIDSAFKRRWDWEYIPIKYSNKDWFIEIGEKAYSWVSFQTKVNNEIQKETHSEDKKLGDFFVTAQDNKIEKKVFLNKVLFYLWNDAFKDGESDLFQITPDAEFTFSDFYGEKGNEMLINFMNKLGVEEIDPPLDDGKKEEEEKKIDSKVRPKYIKFWNDFIDQMKANGRKEIEGKETNSKHYLTLRVPDVKGLQLDNIFHPGFGETSVYIDLRVYVKKEELYNRIKSRLGEVEDAVGERFSPRTDKNCFIEKIEHKADFNNEKEYGEAVAWLARTSAAIFDLIVDIRNN